MFGLVYFIACNSELLDSSVTEINFGDIDFAEEMPEGGYERRTVEVENISKKTLEISIPNFDFEHLCLLRFTENPVEIGELSPNSTYKLEISVCDYIVENGERDSLVEGSVQIESGENRLEIPWSFTPRLNIEVDDSGQ